MLDGPNYYGGCKDVWERKSYRVEYRDVYGGTYSAFATIDDKILPAQEVIVTSTGPTNTDIPYESIDSCPTSFTNEHGC